MFDDHSNFAYGTVFSPPSPDDSGVSLSLHQGEGANFPVPPFNAVIWQARAIPTNETATIVRVTSVEDDVLRFDRNQENSNNRTIVTGDQVAAAITKKTITDIEDLIRSSSLGTAVVVGSSSLDYPTDGIDDQVQINQAITDLAIAGGGTVQLEPGTYNITDTILIAHSNIRLIGSGVGSTKLVGDVGMINDTPIISGGYSAAGSNLSLTGNTAVGGKTVTISTGNAATLTVGDYVILSSSELSDSESSFKKVGEIHRIKAINTSTGVITFTNPIHHAYLTSDSAKIVRKTFLINVVLADMTVTTLAPTSALSTGFINFKWVDNLQVSNVEMHDAYYGMQLISCVNSGVRDCYIYNINDVNNAVNLRYGVWIACASQNIVVSGCRFRRTRHAVTFGGLSQTNCEGVQRDCVISNCTSSEADTAHFDTHEPADNIVFTGCSAEGGVAVAGSTAVHGFQNRGRNCSVIGCTVLNVPGVGIQYFGTVSSGGNISGNMIVGAGSSGIVFDSAGTSKYTVSGNTIKDCANSGISGNGSNHDLAITGNVIDNSNTVTTNRSIKLVNSNRALIVGNKIMNNTKSGPIEMNGTSTDWLITNNYYYNNLTNTPVLANNYISSNNFNYDAYPGYVAKSANYSMAVNDSTVDCVSGSFTVLLPSALLAGNKVFTIKNTGGGNIVVATQLNQLIDSVSTKLLSTAGAAITVQSNGVGYIEISELATVTGYTTSTSSTSSSTSSTSTSSTSTSISSTSSSTSSTSSSTSTTVI